eukprot:6176553-Pleurochrysis_carterae.AAC.2
MVCASLPTETHVYRIQVVQAFLISGTPLERISFFRNLLERAGKPLTDASHLRTYIKQIEIFEFDEIKQELLQQFVSFGFDGTTRGEASCALHYFQGAHEGAGACVSADHHSTCGARHGSKAGHQSFARQRQRKRSCMPHDDDQPLCVIAVHPVHIAHA